MNEKKINILLVDDEGEFVNTLAERMELRGYSASIAQDGQTGIQMVENGIFDIVILDLMMPGLSGLDTLKQIRNLKPEIPVILLTGHGSTRDGMEGMRLGAYDYLMKPLDINELLSKIKHALK